MDIVLCDWHWWYSYNCRYQWHCEWTPTCVICFLKLGKQMFRSLHELIVSLNNVNCISSIPVFACLVTLRPLIFASPPWRGAEFVFWLRIQFPVIVVKFCVEDQWEVAAISFDLDGVSDFLLAIFRAPNNTWVIIDMFLSPSRIAQYLY